MRKVRFTINKPVIVVDREKLTVHGVSLEELRRYLPRYILNPTLLYYGYTKKIWFGIVQCFLRTLVKIFLRPRKMSGKLDQAEVNNLYTRQAEVYNCKHHLTTRGMDLVLRRMAGWLVVTIGRGKTECLKILDLCSGTGLVIKEMISILREWGINFKVIGLDYNAEMLKLAERKVIDSRVQFLRGDAMNLIEDGKTQSGMACFVPNSIDVVTQVFGIGGIPEPLKVFNGVLRVLKISGQFLMIDIHKPIPEQPGEWAFFLRWHRFPIFEMFAYEHSTIPLVLNRLWAWRDTTASFYLLPLITYQDGDGRYWGFKVQSFEQETQKWWFALPLMPIGKIIVEKTEINEETARTRKAILEACVFLQSP